MIATAIAINIVYTKKVYYNYIFILILCNFILLQIGMKINCRKGEIKMENIKLTNTIIDSISMQIQSKDILKYIDDNRMSYLKYVIKQMKMNSVELDDGDINKKVLLND